MTGTASVTILNRDATSADSLSTCFFVVGLNETKRVLQESPLTDVLIVPDKYPTEIWITPGFAEPFIPIPELSNAVRILRPTSA